MLCGIAIYLDYIVDKPNLFYCSKNMRKMQYQAGGVYGVRAHPRGLAAKVVKGLPPDAVTTKISVLET